MTAPERPSPIPDAYRRVTPASPCKAPLRPLSSSSRVGATERMRFPGPGGTILAAEVQIGDSVVMIEDESSPCRAKAPPSGGLPGFPGCLLLDAEDAGTVIACAVELGATL
jgi:PhnB protein